MRYSFVALALALVAGTHCTPVDTATDVAVNATAVDAEPNVTLDSAGKPRKTQPGGDGHATLVVCRDVNCQSCTSVPGFSNLPHGTCIDLGIPFRSVRIDQQSNRGLPFSVMSSADGCKTLTQIPRVNTCFNVASKNDHPHHDIIMRP